MTGIIKDYIKYIKECHIRQSVAHDSFVKVIYFLIVLVLTISFAAWSMPVEVMRLLIIMFVFILIFYLLRSKNDD